MSHVVYASPQPVRPPREDPWAHLEMTWTGWNGSVWSLSGGRNSQAISLQAGVRGLTFPPSEDHTSSSPARRGQRFRSTRELPREVFWPLVVWRDTSSSEWLDWDAAFRRSLRTDREGLWTVTRPDSGASRSILLRLRSDGDPSWDMSPGLVGYAPYQYTLIADQPLWTATPIVREWRNTTTQNFTGPSDAAPSYHVSPALTTSDASITNPCDVSERPVWELSGPIGAGAELTVAGATIGVPFALEEGDTLRIDTDRGTARLNGTRVTGGLSPREFRQWVPDGETVPVGLSFSGTGTVRMTLPQHYNAAW